jgi:uncharacterized protein (DUF4415 family)
MPARKPDPEMLDADAPEATDDWFKAAVPAKNLLPELMGEAVSAEMLKPKRGRPPLQQPKEHVNIRLDADIVQSFRQTGSGWQTRMNEALREWLRSHSV